MVPPEFDFLVEKVYGTRVQSDGGFRCVVTERKQVRSTGRGNFMVVEPDDDGNLILIKGG